MPTVSFSSDCEAWNAHSVDRETDCAGTVSPAQSAHWGQYASDNKTVVVPVKDTELYEEDWIGLKTLDQRGKLWLEHCPGEHMDLSSGDCAKNMVDRWVGWLYDKP